jgi:hypothetical protein
MLIDFQASVLKVGFGRTSSSLHSTALLPLFKVGFGRISSSLHSTALIPRDCLGLPSSAAS